MRLVCDNCSAAYTIDDHLVGERDFSVSCKGCSAQLTVRSRVQVSSEAPQRPMHGGPGRSISGASTAGREGWYASIDGQEQGPLSVTDVSRMLEEERISWTTPVWREGFKAWRPARRDPALVTAVAAVRGNAGDTMRLDSVKSFVVADDTLVETRSAVLSDEPDPTVQDDGLAASVSDTQTLDMRQHLPAAAVAPPPAPVMPDLRPSQPPQALSSPQNAAFRAGLGLHADPAAPAPPPASAPPPAPASEPSQARASSPPRTLGDAFRSAPALMRSISGLESTSQSVGAPGSLAPSEQESWIPKPKSMLIVATLAFSAGLVVAALWGYFAPPPTAAGSSVARPASAAAMATPEVREGVSAASRGPSVSTGPVSVEESTRELPDPEELRNEVRRVAPLVRRCIVDTVVGVDVDIYLDGPSGRVRDVQVRSPNMPGGRLQCVNHAVRQMQLAPFARPELRLMHKFSW